MATKDDTRTAMERAGAFADRLVAVVNPGAALKRTTHRRVIEAINRGDYRGGQHRRGQAHWNPRRSSADAALLPDQKTLWARSRDLARNHPIASGTIETICANEVRSGMRPRSLVDHELLGITREAARAIESQTNRMYRLWCTHADLGGRLSMAGTQDLIKRCLLISGEAFVVRRFDDDGVSPIGLRVDIVEADRVSTPRGKVEGPGAGNEIRAGIELNAQGRPVAYWIEQAHPGDGSVVGAKRDGIGTWVRVPATDPVTGEWNVLHIYKVMRPGQTRGVPFFAPVIDYFQQLDDYVDAELMAARVAACFGVFIKRANPEIWADANADGTSASEGNNLIESLYPGQVEYLDDGEEITSFTPNRPGQSYETFVESAIGFIGAGLGLPPQLITSNFKGMNFSQMRGALVQAGYVFSAGQDFLIERYLQPVWESMVREVYDRDLVSMPKFRAFPDAYFGARWTRPGREAIDGLKEAQADAVSLKNDATTLIRILARHGITLEEHVAEKLDEREQFEASGLSVAQVPSDDPATITKDANGGALNGTRRQNGTARRNGAGAGHDG